MDGETNQKVVMPMEGIRPGSRADYALRYANTGFRVLPLNHIQDGVCSCGDSECRSPGKHPLVVPSVGMFGGVHSATTDRDTLIEVFTEYPQANIGIAIPDDMIDIDIDPRNGGDTTIDNLQEQYGKLPDTAMQFTGGGGLHYLYRKDPSIKVAGKLGNGIDVKSSGGYILAEPSGHVSGRAYVWEASSDPLDGVEIIPAPEWVMNKLAAGAAGESRASSGLVYGVDEKVIGELKSALAYLNAERPDLTDDRDMWVRIGMACKSIGEAGFELWENWSIASKKYDADDQWKKWKTFSPTSISYRTVFALAQVDGWRNPMAKSENVEQNQSVSQQDTDRIRLDTAFKFKPAHDILSNIKPTSWLIKGYVETDSLAELFGPPANGKSLLAIDFACCVATGKEWNGAKVLQGPVFYIAGEGMNGIGRRLKAWCQENSVSLEGMPLYVSETATEVINDEAITRVQSAVVELSKVHETEPSLIIIDTLARNFGAQGDENSTKDMSKFITNLDTFFKHRFKCCVMAVHHSGWQTGRQRGSSALKAGVDCEYNVEKNSDGDVVISCMKMKDAMEPEPLLMRIHQVELDGLKDDEGLPVTSVVMRKAEGSTGIGMVVGKSMDGKEIRASDFLKPIHRGWIPYSQMETEFGCSRKMAQSMVSKCKEAGFIEPAMKSGEFVLTEKGVALLSGTGMFLTRSASKKAPPWEAEFEE